MYELAAEVTGDVNSLDKNGRLVTTNHANPTVDDGSDAPGPYTEAEIIGGNSSVRPVQVSQDDSKSESPTYYNLVDKKRAARADQRGTGNTAPCLDGSGGGGKVGKGNGGAVEEKLYENDNSVMDNALYDNVRKQPKSLLAPSPSPTAAAAAAAGKTQEPILTSVNDFTLIDNAIYNE